MRARLMRSTALALALSVPLFSTGVPIAHADTPTPVATPATASVVYTGPLADLLPLLMRQFPGIRLTTDAVAAGRPLHGFALENATLGQVVAAIQKSTRVRVHAQGNVIAFTGDDGGLYGADATVLPVSLLHGWATDVADQLNHALNGKGGVVLADKRLNSVTYVGDSNYAPLFQSLLQLFDVDSSLGTNIQKEVPLNHLTTTEGLKQLQNAFGPSGINSALIYSEDKQDNDIVLQGPAGYVARAEALLTMLDAHPGMQVNIAVRVADLTPQSDAKQVGITFGGISASSTSTTGSGGTGGSSGSVTPNQFFMPSIGSAVTVNAQLDAMVQHGTASILADPNESVANGETASLLAGQQDPIAFNNGGLNSGNTLGVVNSGIIFDVTPMQIGHDGSMKLKIHAEYSQVTKYTIVAGAAYPTLAQRKMDTVLHVKNGQTIVMGGLTEDVQSHTETSIPVLGDIPLFGRLFHHVDSSHTREEIVFQITPTILTEEKDEHGSANSTRNR